jgi:hypothetical protein
VTDIDIVNMALGQVGAGRIADLGEDSSEAKVAKDHYATVMGAALEDRKWTFSTRREQLVQDAVLPVFRYAKKFVIPSIVLKVWECYDTVDGDCQIPDYTREGQFILADADTVYAVTTYRCGENNFSPTFIAALATRLAGVFAVPLAENRQMMADYMSLSDTLFKVAAAADGQQGRSETVRAFRLPGRRPTL